MELQHTELLKYEPVIAFVTIVNRGGTPLIVNGDQSEDMGLEFEIKDRRGNRVPRLKDGPKRQTIHVEPNGSRRIMVHVSEHYVFNHFGGYHMNAVLSVGEYRYKSQGKYLEIVRGLPIAEVFGHVVSKPTLRRRYQLRYVTREGNEILFLQVADLPDERLIGTYTLGRLLRVKQPQVAFDQRGHLVIQHQSGPNQLTLSVFEIDADTLYLLDQANEPLRGGSPADR